MPRHPIADVPSVPRTLRRAEGLPETSEVVRDWNRQLQRIDRLQGQLAELQALGQQHRQAWQTASAPGRQALIEVQRPLAQRLIEALDGKQLAGVHRQAALDQLARLARDLTAAGHTEARDAHDRHSDISLAERQARERAAWQAQVEGWRRQEGAQQAQREARQARREHRRQRRSGVDPAGAAASGPGAPASEDPSVLLRRLFRQLASALHPDREPDEQQRERKTALMAEANRAHGSGDLLALLRLQQQVLQAEPAAQWDDARLGALVQLLRRQVADLERERAAQQQALAWEAGLPPGVPARTDTLAEAREAALQALAATVEAARRVLASTGTVGGLQRWLQAQAARPAASD